MASDADTSDDDLFEFDELALDEAVVAPLPAKEPSAASASTVGESLAAASGTWRADAGAPGRSERLDPADRLPVAGRPQAHAEDEFEDEDLHPYVVQSALPPIVVPLLLLMVIANIALVGLTWKSMGKPDQLAPLERTESIAPPVLSTPAPSEPTYVDRGLRNQLPELTSSGDDAWAVLEEAQQALDAGEFVAARRSLFSMLTVIDRLDAADRPDLESRAGYLIAESYRLQAQALPTTSELEATESPR